jgi:hypothetical protein
MDTLSPEQIQNWRRIIFMQLEEKMAGAGIYAHIMPESEVIEYWKKMKALVEQPEIKIQDEPKYEFHEKPRYKKPKCDHSNSITGQNGTYCLDCECYV